VIGTVIDDRYRIERELGDGGYEAKGVGSERPVVIQFVAPPVEQAEFERRARAAARIEHAGSIGISDFGVHDGRQFVVTELAGGTLVDAMASGRMTAPKMIAIARPLIRGLAQAHGQGFVHGAITPSAIAMVDGKPKLRWRDLPRAAGDKDPAAADQVSADGAVRGNPTYMAPEQALGKPIDPRTDLYAVSVILWELLIGRPPFAAREPLKLLNLHVNQPVPAMAIDGKAPGAVPPEIEAAIRHGLAKDPADRPHTADEYIVQLDAAMAAVAARDADTTTRMSGMSARLPKLAKLATKGEDVEAPAAKGGGRAGLVVAVLLLVAIGGVVAYVMLSKRHPEPAVATPPVGTPPATTTPPTPTPPPPTPTPAVPAPTTTTTAPTWQAELDAANVLIKANKLDAAQTTLIALRRDHPDAAGVHRALGDLYLARNWPSETLASYRAAIAKDPALRTDPAIIAGAISLLDSSSRWWDAARFLAADVDARAALADAADHGANELIRTRARDVLAKLPAP
jgi:serine/threonine protein kinase